MEEGERLLLRQLTCHLAQREHPICSPFFPSRKASIRFTSNGFKVIEMIHGFCFLTWN